MEEKPSAFKRVTWGPIAAIGVTVLVYFAAQILGSILAGIYPLLQGWSVDRTTDWLAHSVHAQFIMVLLVEVITVWFIWLYLRHKKASFRDIGLRKPQIRDIGLAIAGFAAYFAIYLVTLTVIKSFVPGLNLEQEQELGFSKTTVGWSLGLIFVSLVILPPIVEEIVCRGFLYTGLRSKLAFLPAAIITSIMFACAHLQWGSGNALLWVAAIDTFILSMVLVYLRERTGALGAPIFLHMIKNGLAFAVLFVIK
ncbi:MAG: hypothetical protein JWL85_124 [Candidatus Saccharibacteria bacterium]|nr:hypothetical protein [Candidatus Saccharibacteria bacterium]